ncbi:MAG: hypothetical protein ACPGJS_03640 [Flammeovirgaceae bacterium]
MRKLLFVPMLLLACTQNPENIGNARNNPQNVAVIPINGAAHSITQPLIIDSSSNSFAHSMKDISRDSSTSSRPLPSDINYKPKGQYQSLKAKVKQRQAHYQASLQDTTQISKSLLDRVRTEVTNVLLQEIIPFWYGTEWDFNGYTATPQQGEIACGYLVSTTLRDAGFRLNRYHLAQQASYFAALSLQKKADLKIFHHHTPTELKNKLLHQLKAKSGLYFIGLDNHVGYLLIHQDELYFIHSNYITDRVMIEYAEESQAFGSSIYVIADITYNDALLTKWIKNEVIKIKRGK